MKRILKSKKGVTLLELIVAMLIFSIIAISTTTILAPIVNAYYYANNLAEINTLLDNLSAELLNDLQNASKITISDSKIDIEMKAKAGSITHNVVYDIDNDSGILCRNGKQVLDTEYYKGKTVSIEYYETDAATKIDSAEDTPAFIVRLTVSLVGTSISRDYAVKPLGLNQYIPADPADPTD